MIKTFLVGSGALIAVYLLVSHATDAGKLLTSAGTSASTYVQTLQGR